ncbi:PP2C family protein-serine/threonine phosphatase [Candidatus Venteria ishoeyi]|uniref:Phosphoserine phosphatase RsbU n=1 Tax=Candidatus Venteria ishoeyi TaxID=1899563 RepID=A0A1H6FFM8_9GAMM|nr:SpoIIE family protein phosphatase [Candidatus Venteria ishoeyi]SEH04297.1 Phosphoserine phosphatase RsbU [Candidatus Venteria ishoeyi]SEH06778.1 Phosphoserine phosphatase RsbU [Candidatus Venteria ishoeyi]SEH07845.1 Phosphoserine phosphatase RsbU [Candidatus Venteria ishoeyi]
MTHFKFFAKLSIKAKLNAVMLITSMVLLSVISIGLIGNEIVSLKRNLSSDLLTLADIMGSNGSIGLVFGNIQATADTLASLKAKPNVTEAKVFDQQGKAFAHYAVAPCDESIPAITLDSLYTEYSNESGGNAEILEQAFFHRDRVEVFKSILMDDKVIGTVYIQSNLDEMYLRLRHYAFMLAGVMFIALIIALLISTRLQQLITHPLFTLLTTINQVSTENNYALRATEGNHDEVGRLVEGFNGMLSKIEERDDEINTLNQRLTQENLRMGAELDVSRRLQKMLLPRTAELTAISRETALDIACYMEPAEEIGGDYYDVLYHDGMVKLSIGDVTGHGLESGVVMLMVQTAIRTLLNARINDPVLFLNLLNQTIFDNVQRMGTDKNLTLSTLDYRQGELHLYGQHEELLVIREGGQVERIDTLDLGFMIGLVDDISSFVDGVSVSLKPGDGIVLYTDGITEAQHKQSKKMYGVERLCQIISEQWHRPAQEIQEAVLDDLRHYMGPKKPLDDITLVVVKRVSE